MTATNDEHRPLVSGAWITIVKREGGNLRPIGSGTLTGLARKPDGAKVLVTNLHVLTGSGQTDVSGAEEMYQEDVPLDVLLNSWSTYVPTPGKKVGDTATGRPILSGTKQIADVAMVELESGVAAKFQLHDHPIHTNRKILSGYVDPVDDDDDPMRLLMLGARTGEGEVNVLRVNQNETIHGIEYAGLTIVESIRHPSAGGDSGAPLLFEVGPNSYRMSCIHFASNGNMSWAFPASVAQTALGIKFGNSPPVADASASAERVKPGDPVVLNGSGSRDPDGYRLSFRWEQLGVLESPVTPQVTIVGSNEATASFTAPDYSGALSFQLTVTDSEEEVDTATVNVTVRPPNRSPLAFAGYHQVATVDSRVTLTNATASDPDEADRGRLSHRWRQRRGTTVLLNNPNILAPTFTTPRNPSTLDFRLTVTDPGRRRDTDDVRVRVFSSNATTQWYDTRETDGSGSTKRKRQTRLYKGTAQFRWQADPEEEIWSEWADTGETRNEDTGDWEDIVPTVTRGEGADREKKQTRTVTWEKEQTHTNQCDVAETQWVNASRVEIRWVPVTSCTWEDVDPPETRNGTFGLWLDFSETRNRVVGNWSRTGSVRGNPVTLEVEEEQERTITWEKKQTRTQTWEKKQECVSHGSTETRWVDASSSQTRWIAQSTTETRWVPCTLPDTDWSDTGQPTVSSYSAWTGTGQTRGSGANRECQETRTAYREQKQTRRRNCGTETQWVPTGSTTETRWVSCPEPCTWTDVSPPAYRGCGPDREKRQECVSHGSTETRWVDAPEVIVWGPWEKCRRARGLVQSVGQ